MKAEFARELVEILAGRVRDVDPEDVGRPLAMIGDEIGIADVSEGFCRPVEYQGADHCSLDGWSAVSGQWSVVSAFVRDSTTDH